MANIPASQGPLEFRESLDESVDERTVDKIYSLFYDSSCQAREWSDVLIRMSTQIATLLDTEEELDLQTVTCDQYETQVTGFKGQIEAANAELRAYSTSAPQYSTIGHLPAYKYIQDRTNPYRDYVETPRSPVRHILRKK